MAVFAIVFKESSPQAQQRVQKAYPDCFQLSPTFTVVTTKDVSETVANRAGIQGDDRVEDVSGVVFKLRKTYSGYTTRTLWEWLEQHESDF